MTPFRLRRSVVPGEYGSAVLLGHNYFEGKAVFKWLIKLRKGARVLFRLRNDKTATCKVTKNPKNVNKPSRRQVTSWYDPYYDGRRLMLITCGKPQGGGVYLATTVVETHCAPAR